MKRKRGEISRLKTMIEKDRHLCGEEFFSLVSADVNRVLSEYFEMKSKACFTVGKNGEEIEVTIDFTALRVKKFGTIPE